MFLFLLVDALITLQISCVRMKNHGVPTRTGSLQASCVVDVAPALIDRALVARGGERDGLLTCINYVVRLYLAENRTYLCMLWTCRAASLMHSSVTLAFRSKRVSFIS